MTTPTTHGTPVQPTPPASQPPQGIDWRQLDFAADGLVLRTAPTPKG